VEAMRRGLARARVSGRMEYFASKDQKLLIIVDYAHNKLSFERVFESVKAQFPGHSICVIFGSAGDKALQRRQNLGKIAAKLADCAVLTSVDPGFENPAEIAD